MSRSAARPVLVRLCSHQRQSRPAGWRLLNLQHKLAMCYARGAGLSRIAHAWHQGAAPPQTLGAYAALAGQALPLLAPRMDAGLRQAFCEARRALCGLTAWVWGACTLFYHARRSCTCVCYQPCLASGKLPVCLNVCMFVDAVLYSG